MIAPNRRERSRLSTDALGFGCIEALGQHDAETMKDNEVGVVDLIDKKVAIKQ